MLCAWVDRNMWPWCWAGLTAHWCAQLVMNTMNQAFYWQNASLDYFICCVCSQLCKELITLINCESKNDLHNCVMWSTFVTHRLCKQLIAWYLEKICSCFRKLLFFYFSVSSLLFSPNYSELCFNRIIFNCLNNTISRKNHWNAHIMFCDYQTVPWWFSSIQPCIKLNDNPVSVEYKSHITCCWSNLFPASIKHAIWKKVKFNLVVSENDNGLVLFHEEAPT